LQLQCCHRSIPHEPYPSNPNVLASGWPHPMLLTLAHSTRRVMLVPACLNRLQECGHSSAFCDNNTCILIRPLISQPRIHLHQPSVRDRIYWSMSIFEKRINSPFVRDTYQRTTLIPNNYCIACPDTLPPAFLACYCMRVRLLN